MSRKKKQARIATGGDSAETAKANGAQAAPDRPPEPLLPIVGIGASAGGLAALKAFCDHLPAISPMAYIVVVHMSPSSPSMMPQLLQRVSPLPVAVAADGAPLRPGHIYVAPPNRDISVYHGHLQLIERADDRRTLPIDFFFRSLALDQADRAVGIVLSGYGTDGTLGIREIKAAGGLTMAQSESTAEHAGMPVSAVQSGSVDLVLAPEAMPDKIARYFTHPFVSRATAASVPTEAAVDPFRKIFALLRARTGHDFSDYKRNTIVRRIQRRMGLLQVDVFADYLRLLRGNADELDALFSELLIGVTNFFREPQSFAVLKKEVLPRVLAGLANGGSFRAWIPACSTGEEVYSVAMVLHECLDAVSQQIQLQLFGTDIDPRAIDRAREGVYPESIQADVGPSRLSRFFTREGETYRICRDIRDSVVFSVQNVLKDPPFSRLDLLCCRNLLIYFNADAQRRLIPLFHYTLRADGVLMLGSSETIGGFTTLFGSVDPKWKIYRRQEGPPSAIHPVDFPSGNIRKGGDTMTYPAAPVDAHSDIGQLVRHAVLDRFAPSAVLIAPKGEIIYLHGRTGKYLEQPSGPPTRNILDMAREGLRIELSVAIRKAVSSGRPVARNGLVVKTNGDTQTIDLHVRPLAKPQALAGRLLVVFQDAAAALPAGKATAKGSPAALDGRIGELEKELQTTRENHQITVEELESSNEELKSTNEELHSANEELQSSNEELESSKEEMQSLNEELQTVNAELQSKVDELSAAQADMRNLLNSMEIATIFVDNAMRVKRFTEEATHIVNLIHTDIGRPIHHVVTNLEDTAYLADLGEVLETLVPRTAEVRTTSGIWYRMRIMPYRTPDNRIDGAVLTFANIDDQKRAQGAGAPLEASPGQSGLTGLIRSVWDADSAPRLLLAADGSVTVANTVALKLFGAVTAEVEGRPVWAVHNGVLDQADLKSLLEHALSHGGAFSSSALALGRAAGNPLYRAHGHPIEGSPDPRFRLMLTFRRTRIKEKRHARPKT